MTKRVKLLQEKWNKLSVEERLKLFEHKPCCHYKKLLEKLAKKRIKV